MRYVRLHDGSVYTTYSGDSNLSRQYQGQKGSNHTSGKEYHPIHDIGALIGYYIPSLNMDNPALILNQSGITFDVDNGVWFEDELVRIAKNPTNQQILFQFLFKNPNGHGHRTTVGILEQNQNIFKYVDPHGQAVPNRLCRMIERVMPQVKIKCFATSQVDHDYDSGPIAVDNLVKLSHNEKLFNPVDFMSQAERTDRSIRKRVVHDYLQGLRKSQREALARLGADIAVQAIEDTFAGRMSRLPENATADNDGDAYAESVGFSIDDI